MKYRLSWALGLVLSMMTLFPFMISSSATLQHFSLVLSVSLLTLQYSDMQFCQKVDLPDPGLPTKITISFQICSILLPFPQISYPPYATFDGLNPFTYTSSVSPRNRFQGVLKGMPTFRANLRSESLKSLCLACFLPAASPQKKLFLRSISRPPLNLELKSYHILVSGFLQESSELATNTCISTPISFAIFLTLTLISSSLVFPFYIPSWLVNITILQPSAASLLMVAPTLSKRSTQSWASLGNFAPLFRVIMVSSMSKEAMRLECLRVGEEPTWQLSFWLHDQSSFCFQVPFDISIISSFELDNGFEAYSYEIYLAPRFSQCRNCQNEQKSIPQFCYIPMNHDSSLVYRLIEAIPIASVWHLYSFTRQSIRILITQSEWGDTPKSHNK